VICNAAGVLTTHNPPFTLVNGKANPKYIIEFPHGNREDAFGS
jgi:hypothetical protein